MSPSQDGELLTIWVTHCPFRKDGAPVVGNMGTTVRSVVILETETWKKLCAENPGMATTKFNVGTMS